MSRGRRLTGRISLFQDRDGAISLRWKQQSSVFQAGMARYCSASLFEGGMGMKNRREFMGTAAAGMAASGLKLDAGETLAIAGGPKAVAFPAQKVSAFTKWPRYGGEEKAALSA